MTTLYANDPDVHQTYPITAKEGDLSFSPIVKVAGLDDITATWLGSPGATRDLKVPLSTLPAGYVHSLRLIVPGENDIQLGKVLLEGAGSASFPENPGGGSGVSEDLGSVGSTLTIAQAGTYDLDLTTDLTITVTATGDVSLRVHGTGTVTVAGTEFEIDGVGVIIVVSWPRGDRSAYMVGGGGETPVEPVPDPPTQPGAITVGPTADGYNLSWIASTVAAGYEGQIDGGSYTDYGANVAETLTGLSAGSSHSGGIRAYNSLGAKSTPRTWGPASVNSVGLHEQLLALDPMYYLRLSRGSFEKFGTNGSEWIWEGTPNYDGPALMAGETGSALVGGANVLRNISAGELNSLDGFTLVALYRPSATPGGAKILNAYPSFETQASSATPGAYVNEFSKTGQTHLFSVTKGAGSSQSQWRDGVAVNVDSQAFNANTPAQDNFAYIGSWFAGGGVPWYLSHIAFFADTILDADTQLALATAAGTVGNPA